MCLIRFLHWSEFANLRSSCSSFDDTVWFILVHYGVTFFDPESSGLAVFVFFSSLA